MRWVGRYARRHPWLFALAVTPWVLVVAAIAGMVAAHI